MLGKAVGKLLALTESFACPQMVAAAALVAAAFVTLQHTVVLARGWTCLALAGWTALQH
jgi:hypothetical protein